MITIKLENEVTDKIVIDALKDEYQMVKTNIANIQSCMAVKAVKSHILEDLEYDKKLLKALKRVLAYHMTHDEYEAFIQETK